MIHSVLGYASGPGQLIAMPHPYQWHKKLFLNGGGGGGGGGCK